MKILKKGFVKNDSHIVFCENCNSELEVTFNDVDEVLNVNGKPMYKFTCPVCDESFVCDIPKFAVNIDLTREQIGQMLIDDIMENFDFMTVAETFKRMEWEYAGSNFKSFIPDEDYLKSNVKKYLNEVWNKKTSIYTGRFRYIYKKDDECDCEYLSLLFVPEEWGTNSEDYKTDYKTDGDVYAFHPKTKEELEDIIEQRIKQEGPECNLNNIDVSKITDMSYLFYNMEDFNGNISMWDVSNVINMRGMFEGAKSFNKDISSWDVSNVINMQNMFYRTKEFDQDISSWDMSSVKRIDWMFKDSNFNGDISNWDVSGVGGMIRMFDSSQFNRDISMWDVSGVTYYENIFNNCPIKDEYKPKKFRYEKKSSK